MVPAKSAAACCHMVAARNNNYEESALLTTISYFSQHTHHFLENYYLKSKHSVQKPTLEGPAAYVIPADPAEANRQVGAAQGDEAAACRSATACRGRYQQPSRLPSAAINPRRKPSLPGSLVIRMDQPYSALPMRSRSPVLGAPTIAETSLRRHRFGRSRTCSREGGPRGRSRRFCKAKMTAFDDPASLAGKFRGQAGSSHRNTAQVSLCRWCINSKARAFKSSTKP